MKLSFWNNTKDDEHSKNVRRLIAVFLGMLLISASMLLFVRQYNKYHYHRISPVCFTNQVEQVQQGNTLQLMSVCDILNGPYSNFLVAYWWAEIPNFGDYMSGVFLDRILHKLGYHNTVLIRANIKDIRFQRLFAIGSIIDHSTYYDVIWGSGMLQDISNVNVMDDFRAVRGEQTHDKLLSSYAIRKPLSAIGDPFLLFPDLFPEFYEEKLEEIYDVVFIPNYSEYTSYTQGARDPDLEQVRVNGGSYFIVDMTAVHNWENDIVKPVRQAKYVIATSLHGVILGDVLKKPTRLVQTARSSLSLFKFQDYFSGTGRPLTYSPTIAHAIQQGPHEPLHYNTKALWDTFPIDMIKSIDIYKRAMG